MKIQLINAPTPEEVSVSSRTGIYPPQGLLSIATHISKFHKKLEIEILDGELIGKDKVVASIDGDIVGISSNILSYSEAVEIARVAKAKGAKVLMGGPYVSDIPKIVLREREEVDAVIAGDGEFVFNDFLKGVPLSEIKNFVYRGNERVVRNRTVDVNLDDLLPIDYSLVDLRPYFDNFNDRFSFMPFKRTLSTYSQKGCMWYKQRACVFCEEFSTYRTKSPMKYWTEIGNIVEKHGIDIVFDVADSLLSNKKWFRQFVASKPASLKVAFFIYGRIDDISDAVVEMLKSINCYEVFAGVESGNDMLLKTANKGFTVKDILDGSERLASAGIKLYPSFVLGLPGETMDTLLKTRDLAKRLVSYGNVFEISCSSLLPIPGSRAYNILLQDGDMAKKYKDKDMLPVEEMKQDWVNKFCNVDYEHILRIMEEILRVAPVSSSYGRVARVTG